MRDHPDRFIPSISVDPNEGMDAVRAITQAHETWGVRAVGMFPAGMFPQVPINDKKMYPIYAQVRRARHPGVRVRRRARAAAQVRVPARRADRRGVYDFPELTFVTRHGCEPWADLAVKLMLKWPNLYYSTSAFAPRYYPKAIVDYANTRGADKIIYAGYFPMGLSLERIMAELPSVPFKDDVWPKFLRHNAEKVLGLVAGRPALPDGPGPRPAPGGRHDVGRPARPAAARARRRHRARGRRAGSTTGG